MIERDSATAVPVSQSITGFEYFVLRPEAGGLERIGLPFSVGSCGRLSLFESSAACSTGRSRSESQVILIDVEMILF